MLIFSLLVISLLLGGYSNDVSAMDTVLTIRPNSELQGSELGVKIGNIVLSAGADVMYMSGGIKTEYITSTDSILYNSEGSAKLIIPNAEVKLYLSNNKVSPYLTGNIFKSFANVESSYTVNGKDILTDQQKEAQKELEEGIEEILGVWGSKLGFGAEYKVNDNFGIAGETGMRFIFASQEDSDVDEVTGTTILEGFSSTLGGTYTNVAVNYYF